LSLQFITLLFINVLFHYLWLVKYWLKLILDNKPRLPTVANLYWNWYPWPDNLCMWRHLGNDWQLIEKVKHVFLFK